MSRCGCAVRVSGMRINNSTRAATTLKIAFHPVGNLHLGTS